MLLYEEVGSYVQASDEWTEEVAPVEIESDSDSLPLPKAKKQKRQSKKQAVVGSARIDAYMESTSLARMRSVGLIDDKKKGVSISKTFFERQNKKLLAAKAKRNNEKEVEKKTKQSNLLKFLTKGK